MSNNPKYRVEVDQVNAAEWSQLLERFDDASLSQTWSYGKIHWDESQLSHLVLKRDGEVVAMAQSRIMRSPVGHGIAYLRWGPVCQLRGQSLDAEIVRAMAEALHDEYVKKRRLFLRILPNAFTGSERAKIFQAAFPKFKQGAADGVNQYRTFLVDINAPLEMIRKKLDQKWRNQLNRAEKNNLTIIEGNSATEYKMFLEVYEKMWGRKQFDTTVDVHEFGRICEDLPAPLKPKILVCQHQGQTVSGIVSSHIGNTGVYLLGATHDEGLNTKGAYLLQWTMIQRFKAQGALYYDLGGIDPDKNPGVYHFKRGFSGEDVSHIGALESCEDVLSAVAVRTAEFARGGLRSVKGKLKNLVGGSEESKPADKIPQPASPANANP